MATKKSAGAARVNGVLTGAEILAAIGKRIEIVNIEGIGRIGVKVWTEREIQNAKGSFDENDPASGLKLLQESIVDENGEPAFSNTDIEKLNDSASYQIRKLMNAVMGVNGLAGNVEQAAAKN